VCPARIKPTQIQSASRLSLKFGLYHRRFLVTEDVGVDEDETDDVEAEVKGREEDDEDVVELLSECS
jgi:hypothetical protein